MLFTNFSKIIKTNHAKILHAKNNMFLSPQPHAATNHDVVSH